MDKYKEIEDLISFKECFCTKEILNSQSMKTEVKANEIIKIDMVISGQIRDDVHYIDVYFYSFNDENVKNTRIIFEGSFVSLKSLAKTLFVPIKTPKWTLYNLLEFIDIEDVPFIDSEEKERAVSMFLKQQLPFIIT